MPSSSPLRIWLLLSVVASSVGAQEASSPIDTQRNPQDSPQPGIAPTISAEPEITVEELVQRALKNNPQLPIARETQDAARQRLDAARAFPNPSLQLVPRLAGNRGAADEEIILSQPLDLFGRRRARGQVAAAQLRGAQAASALAERSLIVAVKNAAANLFAAQEAERLGQVQVEVAQLFHDAATRRAQLGDVPRVQVQRANLELLRVQNELTNTQAERLARRATLNQLIGQAPETPLRVALPLEVNLTNTLSLRPGAALSTLPMTGDIVATPALPTTPSQSTAPADATAAEGATNSAANALYSSAISASSQISGNLVGLRAQILPQALASRPDIVSAQAELEARRAQVEVLRRERLPDIELQARHSSFTGSGSTAVRAVITVPLFDFGSNKDERRALKAEARAQEAQIELLRSQAAVQIEQALIRLEQQQQTVTRYRSGIVPETLDLLRKTQIGYAQGASTYLEVLEAQRTLRQVQTEYLQALVGTRTQEAALEGALGATLPAELLSGIANPTAASPPPGVAAPGTVPEGTIPPNTVAPLSPANVPPNTIPNAETND